MKRYAPLLALAATACGAKLLDRNPRDIAGVSLVVPFSGKEAADEQVRLDFKWTEGDPCYRVPEGLPLTVNGEPLVLEKRGAVNEQPGGGYDCERPSFRGPRRPPTEQRTEYVLTDGESTSRAVFTQLHAPRSFRVKANGQEQTRLRNGSQIDIEWWPVTDRFDNVTVSLSTNEEEPFSFTVSDPRVDANHIRFTLRSVRTGAFTLSVLGRGRVGVEACEGFTTCTSQFLEEVTLPVIIE